MAYFSVRSTQMRTLVQKQIHFGIYRYSGPYSFFHSFAIRTIEREHNRNHMITSCVFFLSFWDFSVSISISGAILYGFSLKIVSEYDQEIPQAQTADNPMAPRGRATQPSRDTRKTN